MITEDYVSFETAKLLKEKGFDEATHWFYKTITYLGTEANSVCIKPLNGIECEPFHNSVSGFDLNGEDTGEYAMPTLQMAMKWLREEHKLHIAFILNQDVQDEETEIENRYYFNVSRLDRLANEGSDCKFYNSYEEVCEAAIKYCLKNLI